MSRFFCVLTVVVCLSSCREGSGNIVPEGFVADVMLGMTPVKDQGAGGMCWVYAMLAAIESEHIGRGDSVNLSTDYVARVWLAEQAMERFRNGGDTRVSVRGMAPMVLTLLRRYGAMPHDSYYNTEPVNYSVLARRLEKAVDMSLLRRESEDDCRAAVDAMLDENVGYMPRLVFMYGCQYTFLEFAHSVYGKGEYVSLTSLDDNSYGSEVTLPFADNHYGCRALNVAPDTLVARMEAALEGGHPVVWEGGNGDEHAVCLVGMGSDAAGEEYFVAKNSWGNASTDGMLYLRKDYAARHATVVVLPAP